MGEARRPRLPWRNGVVTTMATPICKTCNDTHRMYLGEEDDSREVMCTHCPSPCEKCGGKPLGPFLRDAMRFEVVET